MRGGRRGGKERRGRRDSDAVTCAAALWWQRKAASVGGARWQREVIRAAAAAAAVSRSGSSVCHRRSCIRSRSSRSRSRCGQWRRRHEPRQRLIREGRIVPQRVPIHPARQSQLESARNSGVIGGNESVVQSTVGTQGSCATDTGEERLRGRSRGSGGRSCGCTGAASAAATDARQGRRRRSVWCIQFSRRHLLRFFLPRM